MVLTIVFGLLGGIFLVLLAVIVFPFPMFVKRLFLPLAILFTIDGIVLVYLTLKQKIKGKLGKFLLLTGASSSLFLVSVVLHNLIYGLFIQLFGEGFWEKAGMRDEPLFFFIAILICPIGFLVGFVGSVVLFIRKRKN